MGLWYLQMVGGPQKGVLVPWEEESDGPLPAQYVWITPGGQDTYAKGDPTGETLGEYVFVAYNYLPTGGGPGHGGFTPFKPVGHAGGPQ